MSRFSFYSAWSDGKAWTGQGPTRDESETIEGLAFTLDSYPAGHAVLCEIWDDEIGWPHFTCEGTADEVMAEARRAVAPKEGES